MWKFITVFVTLERKGHTQNCQTMDYYLVAKEGHEPEIKAQKIYRMKLKR